MGHVLNEDHLTLARGTLDFALGQQLESGNFSSSRTGAIAVSFCGGGVPCLCLDIAF